jgi:hypothetical protein
LIFLNSHQALRSTASWNGMANNAGGMARLMQAPKLKSKQRQLSMAVMPAAFALAAMV